MRLIKITSLFHEYIFFLVHRVEVRKFGVCENILGPCVCACVWVLFFVLIGLINNNGKKPLIFVLHRMSLCCSCDFGCRFLFSFMRLLLLLFLYFCSITFIFILPLFTHPSCSFEHITHTHTRTRVLNAWFYVYGDFFFFVLFFSISSLCHGISEKYKFHFIFRLDFNRKDKRIGKIVFSLSLSLSLSSIRSSSDTYMQRTQESNNLMLWRAFIEH